MRLRQELNKSF